MKNSTLRFVLVLFISSMISLSAFASQHTVSKDPNRVAQYNDLQLAIDDAANGDTILVYGSTTGYGNINVYKPLVLIGEGYNENLGLVASIATLTISRFNSTLAADGSTIMGFNITSSITYTTDYSGATDETRNLSDITVLRCKVRDFNFGNYYGYDNFVNLNIINCVITEDIGLNQYYTTFDDGQDIVFSNCIFDGSRIYGNMTREAGTLTVYEDLSNVRIYNSLFLNYETGLLNNTVGLVFEDNVFFGHELYSSDYAQITWNNNLFYLADQAVSDLLTNENVGSGNLIDVNPLFTTYPATPEAFSYAHDYTLQAGSPALTASVEGGEIGIFGGAYPFAVGAKPPVPQVTEVTIQDGTSSVPVGGTINFNFKAESGN